MTISRNDRRARADSAYVSLDRALLLVAPDPGPRRTYRELFSAAGWRVFSALDVLGGLEVMASHAVDAVVVVGSSRAEHSLAVIEALDARRAANGERKVPALHLVVNERASAAQRGRGVMREDETADDEMLDGSSETASRVRAREPWRDVFAELYRRARLAGMSAEDATEHFVEAVIEDNASLVPSLRAPLRERLRRLFAEDPTVRRLVERLRNYPIERLSADE